MSLKAEIRHAESKDLAEIVAIYNQAIVNQFATAHMEEFDIQERKDWFGGFSLDKHPLLVAVVQNKVVGYISLSPYRKGRRALSKTAEISFYIHNDFHQKGLGSMLMSEILNSCENLGIRNLLAILIDTNQSSIHLLEKFGFDEWGYYPNVADFEGVICGQLIYGRNLK